MTANHEPEKDEWESDESRTVVFDRRPLWIVVFDRMRQGIVVVVLVVMFPDHIALPVGFQHHPAFKALPRRESVPSIVPGLPTVE